MNGQIAVLNPRVNPNPNPNPNSSNHLDEKIFSLLNDMKDFQPVSQVGPLFLNQKKDGSTKATWIGEQIERSPCKDSAKTFDLLGFHTSPANYIVEKLTLVTSVTQMYAHT